MADRDTPTREDVREALDFFERANWLPKGYARRVFAAARLWLDEHTCDNCADGLVLEPSDNLAGESLTQCPKCGGTGEHDG